MTETDRIDLSLLPVPDAVTSPDPEVIFSLWLARVRQLDPAFDALVESDPAYKQGEAFAYLGGIFHQRTNDAVRAVLLASAGGADLDQIGANYDVARLLVTPGNPDAIPPIEAVYESDDAFRHRIQLSWSRLSTAGAGHAYRFYAASAHPDVLDIGCYGPETHSKPGEVWVYVLSRAPDGIPSQEVLEAVSQALNAEEVRPLTDKVTVSAAEMVDFVVDADIVVPYGPDDALIMEKAAAALDAYLNSVRLVGGVVARSGIDRALHQDGAVRVILRSPASDLQMQMGQAPRWTDIKLSKVTFDG